nr:DUF5615 family PIN-like protein [Bacteroidota bacterium]
MKFLCDVHISYKLVAHLKAHGFDSIHVNDILNKSASKDSEICQYADENGFVVITKDADFRDSHFVKRTPKKVIKINLGNIANEELKTIFSENFEYLKKLDSMEIFLVEIDTDNLNLIEI